MEISNYSYVIIAGFLVWLTIAPRNNSPRFGELFLAYMGALLFSLVATTETMMNRPIAFFFTMGGVFAFCYLVARKTIRVTIKNK